MPRLTKLSRSIAGRTALVTGAASGMGRATAELFADEGALVAVADRDEGGAQQVADGIARPGGRAAAFAVDLADPPQIAGLTRALAVELGAKGVTVNCVCPGPIHTGMTSVIPDDAKQKFARRRVPARRYGDPEEVAHMTLSLALPAASYANGAIVTVDGGLV